MEKEVIGEEERGEIMNREVFFMNMINLHRNIKNFGEWKKVY